MKTASRRVIFVVMDGLGGLPSIETKRTELEQAVTPNLDKLARVSKCGLVYPIAPGITVGSVVGHFALFGYDTSEFFIRRGVVEALGKDFPLKDTDIAARGNFATIDERGIIVDRRAGRLDLQKCKQLCELLQKNIHLDGVELFFEPVGSYKFLLVLRGQTLSDELTNSDAGKGISPLKGDLFPLDVKAQKPEAEPTAILVNDLIDQARRLLHEHYPANMVLLRGFSKLRYPPSMLDRYGLKCAAIVEFPTYAGIAKLMGMDVLGIVGTHQEKIELISKHFEKYNLFFIHIKATDSAGEDGDYYRKVSIIEEVDNELIPDLVELNPDVLVVTGDHATPAVLKRHSWHPVPVLLYFKGQLPQHQVKGFGEEFCKEGDLSFFKLPYGLDSFYVRAAADLMGIIMGENAEIIPRTKTQEE